MLTSYQWSPSRFCADASPADGNPTTGQCVLPSPAVNLWLFSTKMPKHLRPSRFRHCDGSPALPGIRRSSRVHHVRHSPKLTRVFPLPPIPRIVALLASHLTRNSIFRRIAHAVVRCVANVERQPSAFCQHVRVHTVRPHFILLLPNDFGDRTSQTPRPVSRIRCA